MPQSSDNAETLIVAGDSAVLARRYSDALYELANEQKQLDVIAADLRGLRSLSGQSPEFQYIAGHPRLSRAQLVKAMQQVASSAKFNALTSNFLMLLAKNRRLKELNAIIDAFLAEFAARRGEFTAEVRSAKALSSAQQEQLAAQLHDIAGGKVHLMLSEDKSLLGGLMVKMGSHLIDSSVKTKLARLERQLKSQQLNTQKGAA